MAKESEMSPLDELRKNIKSEKLLYGTDRVLKFLKTNSLSKIFMCSNINNSTKEDINYYSELNSTPVISLDIPNDELGILLKKPFFISIVGLKK